MMDRRFNALILAGNRREGDTVAQMAGVSHKALAPIHGVPMLLRLYRTLSASPGIANLYVCIDDAALLDAVPELAVARDAGKLIIVPPADSPAASVALALDRIALDLPLLTTTADHPLLTVEMVRHLLAHAPADADLAVGLADATVVRAAYPGAIRTFYRFQEKRVSGCNLFLAQNTRARDVALYWRRMERHRKKPWRLVWEVGPAALLRLACGRMSVDAAFAHISGLTGARIRPVMMPFAEAPIDVDKPADYKLVSEILRQRESAPR